MVQLIVGKKGKGKTKCLLDRVNSEVKNVLGSIAFLDKNTKHMYELNNKIRLIVVSDFMISNPDEFIGFVSGIIQAMVCKPRVRDMESLSEDVQSIKGFYRNRILRVLLVFILSSVGSSIGTFAGGADVIRQFSEAV